jgi:hypothetical protein
MRKEANAKEDAGHTGNYFNVYVEGPRIFINLCAFLTVAARRSYMQELVHTCKSIISGSYYNLHSKCWWYFLS